MTSMFQGKCLTQQNCAKYTSNDVG